MSNDIDLFARAIREHLSVEAMHWHLDVTLKEDANKTKDKNCCTKPEYSH